MANFKRSPPPIFKEEQMAENKFIPQDFVDMGKAQADKMFDAAMSKGATSQQIFNSCLIAEGMAVRTLALLIFHTVMNKNNHEYSPTLAQSYLTDYSDMVYNEIRDMAKAVSTGDLKFVPFKEEQPNG